MVEEELGFAPAGTGQHLLLKVRKRNANTQWVARELARLAGCRAADVGYAGLKDRRAVAVQWFSVPATAHPGRAGRAARSEEFEVLEAHPHTRKLPRGALAGNRFAVRIGAPAGDGARWRAPRTALASDRAARRARTTSARSASAATARNLARARRAAAQPCAASERGFVLSAARSLIFNAVLAAARARRQLGAASKPAISPISTAAAAFSPSKPPMPTLTRALPAPGDPSHRPDVGRRGRPRRRARGAGAGAAHRRRASPQAGGAVCGRRAWRQERRSLRLAVRDLQLRRPRPTRVVLQLSPGARRLRDRGAAGDWLERAGATRTELARTAVSVRRTAARRPRRCRRRPGRAET